jgi:FAD/FMN-containing dehydrogenase
MKTYESWGRYPRVTPKKVVPIYWRDEGLQWSHSTVPVLAYGLGRSYGDSCLNENGILIDTLGLSRFIAFDEKNGILSCEAGTSFAGILDIIVPKGWFLPVTPGTKYVTLGGAIANDIHGKNHHHAGAFGHYVRKFEILLSNGRRLICSREENAGLFRATIGGMGLTGLILWAEIQLKRIPGPFINVEKIRFNNLEEFFSLSETSNNNYEYVVSWLDSTARNRSLGRGIFIRGNHSTSPEAGKKPNNRQIAFPFEAPGFLLNKRTVQLFNVIYYRKQFRQEVQNMVHYEPFFYPLDAILNWNRMYGKRGFFQYQCVVPFSNGYQSIQEILERIASSKYASFLTVLKTFGDFPAAGIMSFPRPGITLALDFPNQGKGTLHLFDELDMLVLNAGGALYPAKDARMSPKMFETSFPNWQEFAQYLDPRFSSNFLRRVTDGQSGRDS